MTERVSDERLAERIASVERAMDSGTYLCEVSEYVLYESDCDLRDCRAALRATWSEEAAKVKAKIDAVAEGANRIITERDAALALLAEAERVLGACKDQWREPGEGHSAYFERQAERFYRETGLMAPGKSQPAEMPDNYGERQAEWEGFFNAPYVALVALLAKLRAHREGLAPKVET